MKNVLKAAALAVAVVSVAPVASVPAAAQSKTGIAVADVRVAMARSNAYTVALQQIDVTYKAQIDARDTRAQTLQAEVNLLIAKYNEEVKRTPQNATALQNAAKALNDKRNSANEELGQLSAPVDLAVAYVEDQISLRMNDAVKAGMTKRKVDLLLNPDAVLARENGVDITDAIVAELNAVLPNVQIVPPAGYQPGSLVNERNRQLMEAARASAAAGGAKPAAPTTSQPTTR
jgi:Skp family chaperone for outer membrane proteins